MSITQLIKKTFKFLNYQIPVKLKHIITYLLLLSLYMIGLFYFIVLGMNGDSHKVSENLSISPIKVKFTEHSE